MRAKVCVTPSSSSTMRILDPFRSEVSAGTQVL